MATWWVIRYQGNADLFKITILKREGLKYGECIHSDSETEPEPEAMAKSSNHSRAALLQQLGRPLSQFVLAPSEYDTVVNLPGYDLDAAVEAYSASA